MSNVKRRLLIGGRDGWRCRYCNNPVSLQDGTIDHIIPKSKGGGNDHRNLCWSCEPCNRDKADKDPVSYGLAGMLGEKPTKPMAQGAKKMAAELKRLAFELES